MLAFVDTANNIIHVCDECCSLQENFDQFWHKVAEQGKLSMCFGNLYLLNGGSVHPDDGIVHMTRKYEGQPTATYWEVKPPAGLVWPSGITYETQPEKNPQCVRGVEYALTWMPNGQLVGTRGECLARYRELARTPYHTYDHTPVKMLVRLADGRMCCTQTGMPYPLGPQGMIMSAPFDDFVAACEQDPTLTPEEREAHRQYRRSLVK